QGQPAGYSPPLKLSGEASTPYCTADPAGHAEDYQAHQLAVPHGILTNHKRLESPISLSYKEKIKQIKNSKSTTNQRDQRVA
ncbi:hypothetical protein TIFTF001_049601, partial [Ficus carica]